MSNHCAIPFVVTCSVELTNNNKLEKKTALKIVSPVFSSYFSLPLFVLFPLPQLMPIPFPWLSLLPLFESQSQSPKGETEDWFQNIKNAQYRNRAL